MKLSATIAIIVLVVGMTLGLATVLRTGAHFSRGIQNESDKWDIDKITSSSGTFTFESLSYENQTSCKENDLMVLLNFPISTKPDRCRFYLDSEFLEERRIDTPSCDPDCEGFDFERTFSLGQADPFFPHSAEVCCDDHCIEKDVGANC